MVDIKLRLPDNYAIELNGRTTTPAYYVLGLIAQDLGYFTERPSLPQVKKWLAEAPILAISRDKVQSKAGKALLKLGKPKSCREIANAAGISYTQAYRQLSREVNIQKIDKKYHIIVDDQLKK